jgi:hypothetical protein
MSDFISRPLFSRPARGTIVIARSTRWSFDNVSTADADRFTYDARELLPSWFCIAHNGVTFALVGPCDRDVSWYTAERRLEKVFIPFNGTPSGRSQVADIIATAKRGGTFTITGRNENGDRLVLVENMSVHTTTSANGGTGIWFKAPKLGRTITLIEKRTT